MIYIKFQHQQQNNKDDHFLNDIAKILDYTVDDQHTFWLKTFKNDWPYLNENNNQEDITDLEKKR